MIWGCVQLVFWTAVFIQKVSCQEDMRLRLTQGEIVGMYETTGSVRYSAFRGIPYAKPPVADLRLMEPEKPDNFNSLDATRFKPECPQWADGRSFGEEDCLYVNVFTPQKPIDGSILRKDLPVMVFIHGGSFQKGSVASYGAERFMEKEVIIVTFHYRLGILGFLSTGDSSCPGNLGLKDQLMALQWVRDNIPSFGGNTNQITIFGQDAGAASVILHILSPKSRGLFQNAIAQSGSPLCDWALEEHPYDYAVDIAKRLDCSTKSTWKMVECIRKQTKDKILDVQKEKKTFGDFPFRALPVVEKDGFIPETPYKLLTSGSFQVPLISGVNKDDGTIFYPVIKTFEADIRRNSSFLTESLIPKFIQTVTDIRGGINAVAHALSFEYFSGVDLMNMTQVQHAFVNMSTDAMFVSCNHKTLQLYATRAPVAYMYTFEYKAEDNILRNDGNFDGVPHGEELKYLFKIANMDVGRPIFASRFLDLWVNFAKTGRSPEQATGDFPKWEPYTPELKNYYPINFPRIEPQAAYRQRSVDLWLNFLPVLSNITGVERVDYRITGFGWAMFAIALILLIAVVVLGIMLFKKSKSQYFEASTGNK